MAFHAQKQEPAWTPQPGRADTSFPGLAQCLMQRDLRASQELPGLRHPHPLAFAQKSSLQERNHGTPEGRPGQVTRTQQGHKLQHNKPRCKTRSGSCARSYSEERVLMVQKGFRTTLMDGIAGKNLLKGLHHQIPELPS